MTSARGLQIQSPRPVLAESPHEYHPVPEGPERLRYQRHRWATASTFTALVLAAVLILVLQDRGVVRGVHDEVEGSVLLSSESHEQSGSDAWHRHKGLKCYPEHGGKRVSPELSEKSDDHVTVEECKKACLDTVGCEAVMMVQDWSPGPCHLRNNIELKKCEKDSLWTLWTLPKGLKPTQDPRRKRRKPAQKKNPCKPGSKPSRKPAPLDSAEPHETVEPKADDDLEVSDEVSFAVGDRIEGKFNGSDWYPAIVKAVNPNGTYSVRWEDEDREDTIKPSKELRKQSPGRSLLGVEPCVDEEEEEREEEEKAHSERFLEIPLTSPKSVGSESSSSLPPPSTTGALVPPPERNDLDLQEPTAGATSEGTLRSGSQSLFDDVATEIGETSDWEVISEDGVEVWSRRDAPSSFVIEKLPKCFMFSGKKKPSVSNPDYLGWVKRLDGPGFVRIHADANSPAGGMQRLVQEMDIQYLEVFVGTCEENGVWPIVNNHLCGMSADWLGLRNKTSEVVKAEGPMHWTNCYHLQRTGKLLLSSLDHVSAMNEKFSTLCSISETCFPTTTTSTSTGTTTSTTSSTGTTTSTTTSWGWPSVFCWSVVTPWGYEPGLVAAQYDRGAGIFNCDNFAVLSGSAETKVGPLEVIQIPDTDGGAGMGNLGQSGVTTNSFLNTAIFLNAWVVVVDQTDALRYDWTAKVDPDAVFFPERLRWHLEQHMSDGGENVFFMNCNRRFGNSDPEPAKLFGSLEVFSKGAVSAYRDNKDRCMNDLKWHGWGEDYFMSHCMDYIGVGRVEDFWMLADNRCNGAPCGDTSKVSFHDFKDAGAWFWCWEQSLGEDGVKEYEVKTAERNMEQKRLIQEGKKKKLQELEHVIPRQLTDRNISAKVAANITMVDPAFRTLTRETPETKKNRQWNQRHIAPKAPKQ